MSFPALMDIDRCHLTSKSTGLAPRTLRKYL